jgi:hypothetical protein
MFATIQVLNSVCRSQFVQDGKTALDIAKEYRNDEIAAILSNNKAGTSQLWPSSSLIDLLVPPYRRHLSKE